MTEEIQEQATVDGLDQDGETVAEAEAEAVELVEEEIEVLEGEAEPAPVEVEAEPAEGEVDELTTLTSELEEAKAQAAEYLDGWQRARAEFANFRRRQEQRQKQMSVEAKSKVLSHVLSVVDDLERAFEAVPDEIQEHAWVNGLSLVRHKLLTALEKDGLAVLEVEAGDTFDPNYHQALTHEPDADYDEGVIIQVVQRGYMLDEVVLRPALVRVSSGKTEAENESE
jgi:molecular chaperone GrpE